jgi:preprotein translocase subunit Sec61beta
MRLLRDPALTRVVAVAVVVGLLVVTAPVLLPVARWVFTLL